MSETVEKVTCRKCGSSFVPSFSRDFYQDGEDPGVGLCESCFMAKAFGGTTPYNSPVPVPEGYLKDVCGQGKGEKACSFLALGGTPITPTCLKDSSLHSLISDRQNGKGASIRSMGDNCSGPPDFKPST